MQRVGRAAEAAARDDGRESTQLPEIESHAES
jgi:hypothetical protein